MLIQPETRFVGVCAGAIPLELALVAPRKAAENDDRN